MSDCGLLSCALIERVNKGLQSPKQGMVRRKNSPLYDSFLLCRNSIRKDLSNIAHKRLNVRFKGLRRVHTPPQSLNAHTAAHRANGAGKRGAALRGTFEGTKICAKRFQIRDGEKPREQNTSRQTAAARQGRVDAVRRRRGSAEPRSPAAILRFAPMGPTVFSVTATARREHICCFTRWSAPCVLSLAAAPLLCPQHPSAADKTGQWKTGSAGSCRADFRFACARPA